MNTKQRMTLLAALQLALHAPPQLLQLIQRLFRAVLAFPGLCPALGHVASLLDLPAEVFERVRHDLLTRRQVGTQTAAHPLGAELHAQSEFVLLGLTQRLPQT